jgi:hypothetical protein
MARHQAAVWYAWNSSGSGQGPVEGSCKHGNEPSHFIKRRENFSVAERLVASQEELNYIELVKLVS